jgi:putative FmdB family regulatory protein
MPIFDYQCLDCQETVEIFVRGEKTITCPLCQNQNLERKYSAAAVKTKFGLRRKEAISLRREPKPLPGTKMVEL